MAEGSVTLLHRTSREEESGATFRAAARVHQSFTAAMEKRALLWLAARVPARIHSDHLTALGLLAMLGVGASYALARYERIGWLLAIFFLAINWFGDSLDGTLARVRNAQRPRYGFYVDKMADCLGAAFLLAGLGLSGSMSPLAACVALLTYFLLSLEVYAAAHTLGVFHMSFGGFGPTELRLLLAAGNAWMWWSAGPQRVEVLGREFLLLDVCAMLAAAGMALMAVTAMARHARELYRAEPLPRR
jgi:phosphatidylglycerophosphate synthase